MTVFQDFREENPKENSQEVEERVRSQANEEIRDSASSGDLIKVLPTKRHVRPLLFGQELDKVVQQVVRDSCRSGGVINTTIVVATTKGVVSAKNPLLLLEKRGHLNISSSYAKSVLKRMGYVKRKGSNAGKVTVECFEEAQEEFLVDIKAELLMHDILLDLVFNWDQTGIHIVPTGEWKLHQAKDKIIPIAHSDDKRQITGVFAVTGTGNYFSHTHSYYTRERRSYVTQRLPLQLDGMCSTVTITGRRRT